MAEVLSATPFPPYSYRDEQPCAVLRDGGPYEEVRVPLADISRRRYMFDLGRRNADRQTMDAFLVRARQLQYQSFYFPDPRDDALDGVSIGTGNGVAQTFYLPTTGENRRFYPADDDSASITVNGSPYVGEVTVSTDGRSVTLASAPANGHAVLFSGNVYRLCRLDDLSWSVDYVDWATASISIVEVIGATG